jgi:hypothetical protein
VAQSALESWKGLDGNERWTNGSARANSLVYDGVR